MVVQNDLHAKTIPFQIAKQVTNWGGTVYSIIKENRLVWAVAAISLLGLSVVAYIKSKQFPFKTINQLQDEIRQSIDQLARIVRGDVKDPKQIIKLMNDSQKVWLDAYKLLDGLKPQYLSRWHDDTEAFYEKCNVDGSIESNTYILRGFEKKTKGLQNARLTCKPYLEQAINSRQ